MENVIAKLYKLAEGTQDLLVPEFIENDFFLTA